MITILFRGNRHSITKRNSKKYFNQNKKFSSKRKLYISRESKEKFRNTIRFRL
jgi:hypothetical protein